jgi:SSS family solute:Na+ symporter
MNIVLELSLFSIAVIGVIAFGIWKARDEISAEDAGASGYFLAGRGLTWWLVGFSLIAANISTEQFVGMSGSAANWLGMAVASYEWMAAVTLVLVAFFFLPRVLRTGIYTIPEFLEYRFGLSARIVMALLTIFVLVVIPTASFSFSDTENAWRCELSSSVSKSAKPSSGQIDSLCRRAAVARKVESSLRFRISSKSKER